MLLQKGWDFSLSSIGGNYATIKSVYGYLSNDPVPRA